MYNNLPVNSCGLARKIKKKKKKLSINPILSSQTNIRKIQQSKVN